MVDSTKRLFVAYSYKTTEDYVGHPNTTLFGNTEVIVTKEPRTLADIRELEREILASNHNRHAVAWVTIQNWRRF